MLIFSKNQHLVSLSFPIVFLFYVLFILISTVFFLWCALSIICPNFPSFLRCKVRLLMLFFFSIGICNCKFPPGTALAVHGYNTHVPMSVGTLCIIFIPPQSMPSFITFVISFLTYYLFRKALFNFHTLAFSQIAFCYCFLILFHYGLKHTWYDFNLLNLLRLVL